MGKSVASMFRGKKPNTAGNGLDVKGFTAELERDVQRGDDFVLQTRQFAHSNGLENFGDMDVSQQDQMSDLYSNLEEKLRGYGIESQASELGEEGERIKGNQVSAALYTTLAYEQGEQSYRAGLESLMTPQQGDGKNVIAMDPAMSGPYGTVPTLSASFENYNEKATRDFRVISVAYNLSAARQDAFGEAIYPTVVINPAEGGITQNLTYAAVMDDVYHKAKGQKYDTREVNMVEAYRTPEILEDFSTKLVPIYSEQNDNGEFADPALIPPRDIQLSDGTEVQTAPLALNKSYDLISITNQQHLVEGGQLDVTDSIDPALTLDAIYVKSGTNVFKFNTGRIPTALFQPNLIGDTRDANLIFHTDDLLITGEKSAIDGSKPAVVDQIDTAGFTVRLSANVNGKVSLSLGNTSLGATPVSVEAIHNESGEKVALESGTGKTVVDALGNMEVVGFDLDGRFTNTNRRERGQLVQTRTKQYRYAVPMHSPITLPMSTMDNNGPGEVVNTLTVATNIRNSNNAVKRLLNYMSQLRDIVGNGSTRPDFGVVEGALATLMRPTYRYDTLDLRDTIDTLRSKDRWDDVCSAILNKVKGMLYPAYRESNIEAVFQTVSGNADEKPKFIIACDKEIANYLMTKGDVRTLGAQMEYDIVSTNNDRFDGKLVVIPTRKNPSEDDILNYGQFYYVPTIIADLPISRHGQISREIAAVPFNLHVNNIPFAIELDVLGLAEVMGTSANQKVLPGFEQPTDDGSTTDNTTTDDTTTTT